MNAKRAIVFNCFLRYSGNRDERAPGRTWGLLRGGNANCMARNEPLRSGVERAQVGFARSGHNMGDSSARAVCLVDGVDVSNLILMLRDLAASEGGESVCAVPNGFHRQAFGFVFVLNN